MAKKLIIDWKEYNQIVEKLAIQIYDSGFKPDLLIGIMRGGAPIIDVLSRVFKLKCAYLAVESYSGENIEDQQGKLIFSRELSSTVQEMNGAYGLNKLGLEHLNPIIARGVLLDIAAVRGVDVMEVGDMIKMADVKAALKAQGMSDYKMMPGDAILFHTGWDQYWVVDNAKYNSGCPGIGMEVARWISGGNAGVTGFDTKKLQQISSKINTIPEKINLHKTILKILDNRKSNVKNGTNIDWSTAEALAFVSLRHENN